MNFLPRSLAAPFLFAAAFSAAHAADEITLKQQWQVGKRYEQTMKMDQATTMTNGGKEMVQKVQSTVEMSMTIKKQADGPGKRVAIKYERMLIDIDMNGQKMTIDSTKPEAGNPAAAPIAAMTGKEIGLTLDANDKVTGVENLDALIQAAGGAGNPMVTSFLNKDAFSKMLSQAALQGLPTHPIKPGDSWPFSVDLPMPMLGTGKVQGTYTYKGPAEHGGVACAEIAVEGKMDFDMPAAPDSSTTTPNPVAQLGVKIQNATMKGTVWFDNALGMARDSDVQQEMTITMKNPAQPGETMKMPMKQTIKMSLTKVTDAP